MDNACRLPVSEIGALMPDAHVGYGLPIGGVLATLMLLGRLELFTVIVLFSPYYWRK